MNIRLIIRSLLVLVLVIALWFSWWALGRSPEEQLRVAQAEFIEAIQDRDWDDLQDFFAADYTDAYGHNRETVVQTLKQYISGFFTLDVKTSDLTVQAVKGQGIVKLKAKLEGNGTAVSQMVLQRVNQMEQPRVFLWSNPGRWPWNWRLSMVHNDEVR